MEPENPLAAVSKGGHTAVVLLAAGDPLATLSTERGAWRTLRLMRSDPPEPAAKSERRAVFSAALEQAEQLFRGAAAADYAVRPLLLFYGYSQAARALAASAPALDGSNFRSTAHGMGTRDLSYELAAVQLCPHMRPGGLLTTLQLALGVRQWTEPFTLGQLWAAHPDLRSQRLPNLDAPEAVTVSISEAGEPIVDPLWVTFAVSNSLLIGTDEGALQELFRRHYPTLASSLPPDPRHFANQAVPPMVTREEKSSFVYRSLPREGRSAADVIAATAMTRANGERWLIPRLGGDSAPHLVTLWWALLFALSMRARYEPEGWTKDLDPDRSDHAVILETVLDAALDVCPKVIATTISELNT